MVGTRVIVDTHSWHGSLCEGLAAGWGCEEVEGSGWISQQLLGKEVAAHG